MTLRPPARYHPAPPEPGPLDHEIAQERAASLGRAGRRVEETLARLREGTGDRNRMLGEAADAVYAYFVQRELCGMRRHDAVIRFYDIPKAVLARLGAKA